MSKLIFCTGNDQKFATAQQVCLKYGVELAQYRADIPEIQSEDPEAVARDKAAKAFAAAGKPVIITDDSWSFPGLGGFPGAYMHSVNLWLTPEDLLRLTQPLQDRRAIFVQHLIYDDGLQQKVFNTTLEGTLLKQIQGQSKYPSHMIISLDPKHGKSIAEAYDAASDKSERPQAQVWKDFVAWFTSNK